MGALEQNSKVQTDVCEQLATACLGLPDPARYPGWAETQSPVALPQAPQNQPSFFLGPRAQLCPIPTTSLLAHCPSSWGPPLSPGSMLIHPIPHRQEIPGPASGLLCNCELLTGSQPVTCGFSTGQ